jgi:hypothetical protein
MSMMYGSFVRKIAKIPLTSSTIHIIIIIISLGVIIIEKLNHIAKHLCIMVGLCQPMIFDSWHLKVSKLSKFML